MSEPKERRRAPRRECRTGLRCATGRDAHLGWGQIRNFGEGGLFFESEVAYRLGDKLHLRIEHYRPDADRPESDRVYLVEVRFCQPLDTVAGKRYGIGVRYEQKLRPSAYPDSRDLEGQSHGSALRRKAEQYLGRLPTVERSPGADEARQILHELHVHQMELEMQNDELRRAQQEIAESRNRYAFLYDFAPLGYFTLDLSGTIREVNLTGTQIRGLERQYLIQKPFALFITPETRPTFERHFRRTLQTRKRQTCEIKISPKGKDAAHVRLDSLAVEAEPGHPEGVLTAAINIDRQKALEEQFLHAQKMEAIGTLAGGVAHDFNKLLMGMLGNVSLMQSDLESGDPHRLPLTQVQKLIESAARLSKQLLGFAQGGKYDVRVIDINGLVSKTLAVFTRAHRDIVVRSDLQENLWAVEGDRSQLEQVLLNLFINAGEAMPQGGRLVVSTANTHLFQGQGLPHGLTAGPYVLLRVSDTGGGMDEAVRKRVFEPFFTTKPMGRGTGLGLASVHGIIQNHHGRVNVSSRLGKGSTFTVYLPAAEPAASLPKGLPQKPQSGTETILLVDDEPVIRDVGARILDHLGYQVLLAASGEEAIEMDDRHPDPIDLVLLDLVMPGMGGGETFDRLRARNPHLKVLLATGKAEQGLIEDIIARGCHGVIEKPFSILALSNRLRDILGPSSERDPDDTAIKPAPEGPPPPRA
jgi:PAS domain S-box-containing protein